MKEATRLLAEDCLVRCKEEMTNIDNMIENVEQTLYRLEGERNALKKQMQELETDLVAGGPR